LRHLWRFGEFAVIEAVTALELCQINDRNVEAFEAPSRLTKRPLECEESGVEVDIELKPISAVLIAALSLRRVRTPGPAQAVTASFPGLAEGNVKDLTMIVVGRTGLDDLSGDRKMHRRRFIELCLAIFTMSPEAAVAHKSKHQKYFLDPVKDGEVTYLATNLAAIPPEYHRQLVDYTTQEAPGTIIVHTLDHHLHFTLEGGKAIRFGCAVGRDGARWEGRAKVGRKASWPPWHPTAGMRKRNPKLPVRMAGGPRNPLGARALYLYRGSQDTLYRIHGTNEPWSIGKRASSGCLRMLNEDIIYLHSLVPIGTPVVVAL
jgi:lipoprotein-anchoring transpeptidase ErfK/SrfK